MLVLKTSTSISATSAKRAKSSRCTKITTHQSQLCTSTPEWARVKSILIWLTFCFLRQWIGLSSCGAPRQELVQSWPLKAHRSMSTMPSGVQLIRVCLLLATQMASLTFGTSTAMWRRLPFGSKSMSRAVPSIASGGLETAAELPLETARVMFLSLRATKNYTSLSLMTSRKL